MVPDAAVFAAYCIAVFRYMEVAEAAGVDVFVGVSWAWVGLNVTREDEGE